MKTQENDDWFDKVMLFFANWSRPIADEFFKLLQWLFLMAALSFLSIKSNNSLFKFILVLSVIMVWFYMMFGYNKMWHKKFHKKYAKDGDGFKTILQNHVIWSIGAVVISIIAKTFFHLADLFGKEAALLLYK